MDGGTLRGVFAPTLTPVDEGLRIDAARWIEHCRTLLANGCNGLCPFGTTSEATSFSVDERIDALEQLTAAGVPAAKLMPGTGCSALTDTVRLTRHAVDLGCGGVLMLPPFYYKDVNDEGIYRSIAEVIERVGDARLRVYLYHIPPQAVICFSLDLLERLTTDYPGVVVGPKMFRRETPGTASHALPVLARSPGRRRFCCNARLGGAGSINAVANVIAPIQQRLFETGRRRRKSCGDDQPGAAYLSRPFRHHRAEGDCGPLPQRSGVGQGAPAAGRVGRSCDAGGGRSVCQAASRRRDSDLIETDGNSPRVRTRFRT